MKYLFKRLCTLLFMFLFSGTVYVCIELLFRGRTTFSMWVVGGICGMIISQINNYFSFEMDFVLQVIMSMLICTAIEGYTGLLINQDFSIWDYRHLWGTFLYGQLNMIFMCAWGLISMFSIPILDYLEWVFFDERNESYKPYYKVFGKRYYLY